MLQEDGSFLIRGDADLEDVNTVLALHLADDTALKEFSTLSGFLCMCAGEIPATGDLIMSRGWCFTVEHADDKRVLLARVERLIGDEAEGHEDISNNPIRALLRLKNNNDNESSDESTNGEADENSKKSLTDEMIKEDIMRNREENIAQAKEIERIVDSGRSKIAMLKKEQANGTEQ